MTATGATTARCSDPLGIGCTRTITPAFRLPSTPAKTAVWPCQRCRYQLRERERVAAGKPKPRVGKYERGRL